MLRAKLFCASVVLVAMATATAQAELITGVSASASSFANSSYYQPVNAVDGAGLSGTNHSNVHTDSSMWITAYVSGNYGLIDQEYLTIDLKKDYQLDSAHTLNVWNFNDASVLPETLNRGIKVASFWYLADDGGPVQDLFSTQPSGTFTKLTGVTTNALADTFDRANGSNSATNYNTVAFNESVNARYIRIKVEGGYGVGNYGGDFAGLSEVQVFAAPVPEPASAAMTVTALFGLLAYAWRKRK
jgi:hypothetical protein